MRYSKVRYDLIFLLIMIAGSVIFIKKGLDRYDYLRDQEIRLVKELSLGTAKKKAIISRLNDLETDSQIEMIARTRLGYVKSGELAYKVITKE